jgi:hypothetical protein
MNMMLGVIAVCLDIAILVALGTNPYYSAEVRWACFALVALFSLPPVPWPRPVGLRLATEHQGR